MPANGRWDLICRLKVKVYQHTFQVFPLFTRQTLMQPVFCFFLNRKQLKFTVQHNNVMSRNNALPVSVRNNQHKALAVTTI